MLPYRIKFLTWLSATALLLASPASVSARLQCSRECQNDGQCVFEWRTAPQSNDAFIRVMACQCTPGYTGPSCEEAISDSADECTLDCKNGGECVFEWMAAPRASDGVMYTSSFMVCECPDGYTGLECEHQFENCPDGKMCFNKAKCVVDKDKDDGSLTKYRCDCASAYKQSESSGKLCDQSATEYCDYGSAVDRKFFCANGGKCKRMTLEDTETEHHGCDCPDGFEGNHCEHSTVGEPTFTLTKSSDYSTQTKQRGVNSVAMLFIVLGVVFVASFGAILLAWKWKSRDNGTRDTNHNPNDHVLDADGGNFPAVKEDSSSQDGPDGEII